MKTANDVLDLIDREIDEMQRAAAGPCIDALVEWSDRDAYREAMRRAYGLKAVQALRDSLAGQVEGGNGTEQAASAAKRRGTKKKG